MKVKESISNKKKNALPLSKLLKPKKFKPSFKKSGDGINKPLNKDKLKLVSENFTGDAFEDQQQKILEGKLSKTLKSSVGSKEKTVPLSKKSLKESKLKSIPKLFDFVTSQDQEGNEKNDHKNSPKDKRDKSSLKCKLDKSSPNDKRDIIKKSPEKKKPLRTYDMDDQKENETSGSNKQSARKSKGSILQKKKKKAKLIDEALETSLINKTLKSSAAQKISSKVERDQTKEKDQNVINKCKLKSNKVAAIMKGLLKLINESSSSKIEMLDVGEPIFLQVECIKIPICPTKQLRFKLPHPIVDETSDVLLITSDLKGHKIFPDKAVEHYEELLAKHDIDFINKVMPLRMLKKEYSQFEMKRKLVDQFDVILADSRIIRSLPSVLGKFAMYKRKMSIPVNLTIGEHKLKKHLRDATFKTQMTVKSNGHCSVVQIGHSKMSAEDMAENVVEVAKSLESLYPGGWRNVRCLVVKTAKSTSLPVYMSLLSPNEVKIPVEVHQRPTPVEGELSTMPGYNVLVTPDGNVVLKKTQEDINIDDSRDNEILEEAKEYLESSKTVRYDESSDEDEKEKVDSESDGEGEAITEAMEKKLMTKYEKNAKKKNNKEGDDNEDNDEEEDEEEEEEEEEESEPVPVIGKKRKSQVSKKQSGPPAKKAFSSVKEKGLNKADKSSDNKKSASPRFKKPQTRGTRGGKKNKMSKDQRKALIKRKKAGKK